MDWYLNPALTTFRNEVNKAYPDRDKRSDGTIGDAAHQATSSDHNPDSDGSVDAWDMDVDLKTPNDAKAIEDLKKKFQAHPAARYWIHNRQIAERKYGWARKPYSGPSPHTEHVHWNSEPTYERSTKPWGVVNIFEEEDMPTAQEIADAVWAKAFQGTDGKDYPASTWLRNANIYGGETVITVRTFPQAFNDLKAQIAAIQPGETPVVTDEQLERVLRKVVGSVDNVS